MKGKYLQIVKFRDYHTYEEIVELAKKQFIQLPEIPFNTKEELVKYILDNGFKIGG